MRYRIGVAIVSISLIALEIGLTRIFSCMIWYHLSFLTISLTMLGFSFGGLLLVCFPSLTAPNERRTVPACAALFACFVSLGTVYVFLQPQIVSFLHSHLDSARYLPVLVYFGGLLAIFLMAFLFSGLAICAAITQKARDVGRVYFANLIGSGLGCGVIILALSSQGAFRSMLTIIGLAALAPFFFRGLHNRSRLFYGLSALTLLGATMAFIGIDRDTLFARPLLMPRFMKSESRIYREWNSFSVVDFFYQPQMVRHDAGLWGLSPAYKGKRLEQVVVLIDSWAVTTINKVEEDTLDLELFDFLPSNLAYRLKKHPDVLIMGAGGGLDVLAALHYDANSVRAVEINPSIVKAVRTTFADYAGEIYEHPKVEVIVGEGRHMISKDRDTYDMIQLSGVDTLSGAQASSYSFSESYLYTREAFDEFLTHLNTDGIITFLRFAFDKPREMLRLFTTAAEALRGQGVQDVGEHVVVIHSNRHVFAIIMIKKTPFSREEINVIRAIVRENGFRFLYDPFEPVGGEFDAFLASEDWRRFYAEYPFRIQPVSDNDPFFFNYTKLSDVFRPLQFGTASSWIYILLYWVGQTILYYGFVLVLLLSLLFIGAPLLYFWSRRRTVRGKYRFIAYFVGLGLAFMFVEIQLMQRFTLFLGQPIYSLALVLFSLLVFAGLGSRFSARIEVRSPKGFGISFSLLLATLLVTYLLTEVVFVSLLRAPIMVRAAVSIALLAPPSFLMGVPYPLGVRLADAHSQQMVPWGWAINGYGSVLGSFLSVILGVAFGFSVVYAVAAVLYGACALLILSLRRGFVAV
jgi:spermidine synthase